MGLREILLVATGGAVGSSLRYTVTGVTERWYASLFAAAPAGGILTGLPFGTFVVNITGSLLIGLAAGLAETRTFLGPETRLLLVTGILGGYTTFSAFSLESLLLIRSGQSASALLSIFLQVSLGVAAAWLGFMAGLAAGRPA
ncbi:MAG: CrcB family protein [Gammaproteobacteria bacterium]